MCKKTHDIVHASSRLPFARNPERLQKILILIMPMFRFVGRECLNYLPEASEWLSLVGLWFRPLASHAFYVFEQITSGKNKAYATLNGVVVQDKTTDLCTGLVCALCSW